MKKANALQRMNLLLWWMTDVSSKVAEGKLTDGEQSPGDDSGTGGVTLLGRKGVPCRGRLEEDEGEEDKDLGEDARRLGLGIRAAGLEQRDDDENDGPWALVILCGGQLTAVEEREGKVDEELGRKRFPAVVLGVDDVVDLADGSGNEQAHEEGADEVAVSPEPDVDRVEDAQESKAVRDAVNDEPGSELKSWSPRRTSCRCR